MRPDLTLLPCRCLSRAVSFSHQQKTRPVTGCEWNAPGKEEAGKGVARRIHPHHRARPRPRRRDPGPGAHPQRVNQASVSPEWRLDKSAISRGLTFAITAAMGNFFEPVARLVQEWVGFWSAFDRSEEYTSELQSLRHLLCR